MAKPTHNAHLDTDGLQADVMRFMAIIAFCLIAILALVKNLDPPKPEAEIPMSPLVAESVARSQPLIVSFEAEIDEQDSVDTVVIDKVVEVEEVAEVDISQGKPPADTAPDSQQDRPLRLRFSSDAAFLSLIAGNGIQLYGLGNGGITGMTPSFTTTRVQPSGELYELLPGSVPRKLVNIFDRESAHVTYLVALSDNTRRELNVLMQRINTGSSQAINEKPQFNGTLVIHPDGHVSHEI
jgi:hypothetical protein